LQLNTKYAEVFFPLFLMIDIVLGRTIMIFLIVNHLAYLTVLVIY